MGVTTARKHDAESPRCVGLTHVFLAGEWVCVCGKMTRKRMEMRYD